MSDDTLPSSRPATKWDVAMAAAQSTLALRQLLGLVISARMTTDHEEFARRVDEVEKRIDGLWAVYQAVVEGDDATFTG